MIRFVLKDGKVPVLDCKGKVHGRGANICAKLECFEDAIEKGAFGRAWAKDVDKESLLCLRREVIDILDQREFRQGKDKVVYRVGDKLLKKKLDQDIVNGSKE